MHGYYLLYPPLPRSLTSDLEVVQSFEPFQLAMAGSQDVDMSSVNSPAHCDCNDCNERGVDVASVDEDSIESDSDDGVNTFRYKDLPTEVQSLILAHLVSRYRLRSRSRLTKL
jgi:hypothetical protein